MGYLIVGLILGIIIGALAIFVLGLGAAYAKEKKHE